MFIRTFDFLCLIHTCDQFIRCHDSVIVLAQILVSDNLTLNPVIPFLLCVISDQFFTLQARRFPVPEVRNLRVDVVVSQAAG